MDGIYCTSRNKSNKGKIYARDDLAFLSFLLADTHQNDPDFIKWNKERLKRMKQTK